MALVNFPIRANEPTFYFASRYARSRGVKLYNFMRHSGINLMNSAKGVESSIKLSSLTGNSSATLQQHGMVRTTSKSQLFGQVITRGQLELERPRFCPLCIAQDVEQGNGRASGRPYLRAAWLVKAISFCPHHGVAIATLPRDYSVYCCADFSNSLHDNWASVCRMVENPEWQVAAEFDRYFTSRLHGEDCQNEVLDSLYYSDAITFCHEIGALDLGGHSKNRERKQSNGEFNSLCREGFDLIKNGFDDLRNLLELATTNRTKMSTGFGSVLHHIAVNLDRPGYSEVADLARDVAFSRTTVRRVLGKTRSDNYTIRMAADAFSLGQQTAKKIFDLGVQGGGPFIAPNVAEELISKWNDRIGRLPLSKFLNVNTQVLDEIEQAGLLARHTLGQLGRPFFLKAEVEAFLACVAGQATFDPALSEMQPLIGSRARVVRVLTGILDGTVRAAIKPSTNCFNLSDLLVHHDDLYLLSYVRPPGTWTTGEVQMGLRVSANLLKNLSREKVLDSVVVEDKNGNERVLYSEQSVLRFKERYISVRYLSRRKDDIERVQKRLAGIQPVFDFGGTDKVYNRSDITT